MTLHYVTILVHNSSSPQPSQSSSVCDPTEKAIEKTIEGIRRLLNPRYDSITPEEEAAAAIKINPATQKHSELQIKTLQDAPRDPDKLRELLKMKHRQYEKATSAEEIQALVTEIEMLKFVQFLVNRQRNSFSLASGHPI
jgi:hypothetical protein